MTRTTYISDKYANEMNMAGIRYQQPPPISGPIKIDLIWCTYLHRPCSVCGVEIEKKSVVAESHWVRVCENCLKYGDQIDEILARHASRIEEKRKQYAP